MTATDTSTARRPVRPARSASDPGGRPPPRSRPDRRPGGGRSRPPRGDHADRGATGGARPHRGPHARPPPAPAARPRGRCAASAGPLLLLAVWQVLCATGVLSERVMAPPGDVFCRPRSTSSPPASCSTTCSRRCAGWSSACRSA